MEYTRTCIHKLCPRAPRACLRLTGIDCKLFGDCVRGIQTVWIKMMCVPVCCVCEYWAGPETHGYQQFAANLYARSSDRSGAPSNQIICRACATHHRSCCSGLASEMSLTSDTHFKCARGRGHGNRVAAVRERLGVASVVPSKINKLFRTLVVWGSSKI